MIQSAVSVLFFLVDIACYETPEDLTSASYYYCMYATHAENDDAQLLTVSR